MTQINLGTGSDIPSNCNTVEKVFAWAALLLERINPNAKIIQNPGSSPVRVADSVLVKTDTGGTRLLVQALIPVRDSYPESPAKFWENAAEIDTVAIPAAFKTN